MKEVIEKLDSYQILTNLVPGIFFGMGLRFLFDIQLPTEGIVEDAVVYYFMGLVVSRFGSIVIEPCLRSLHLIKFVSYSEFVNAERKDTKITVLLTASNYARSLLTYILLFLIIWLLKGLMFQWKWLGEHWEQIFLLALAFLFFASYKKQTNYIYKRVKLLSEANQDCS